MGPWGPLVMGRVGGVGKGRGSGVRGCGVYRCYENPTKTSFQNWFSYGFLISSLNTQNTVDTLAQGARGAESCLEFCAARAAPPPASLTPRGHGEAQRSAPPAAS